ncbi:hypothetical protein PG996_010872 [Apiospora saccharicola]|uniref:feruloyl esterase n=1 Tax=Apiospora saccharicola TaxID=335842 RepID=A0ABR1UPV1_9PEZI
MQLPTVLALLLSAGAAAADSNCGAKKPPFTPGELSPNQTTAKNRRYRVHLPSAYDPTKPTPVIFSYHGAHGTIESQAALDQLTDPVRNRDYIVVYLQGLVPEGSDKTEWQVAPGAEHTDDLGFTSDVVAALEKSLCIDPRRLYATGKSQGGGFVGQVLACDPTLSRRFAAFAPVAGAYYIKDSSKSHCEPTDHVAIPCDTGRKDTPMMAFHGGADATIPYRGTYRSKTHSCLPDIRHWAREWAVVRDAGLQGTQSNTTIAGSKHGVRSAWGAKGSKDEERVVLVYAGDDVGHDWPSTAENADNKGGPRAAFNASDDMLRWFGKWKL